MKTISDVAKKAGTSTATVSHVINKTRFVSEELTQKVNKAIKDMNYMPNLMARGLKIGSSKTIGVILPDCTNNFFAEIAQSLDRNLFEKGYNIILCNTDNKATLQSSYTDMLISKNIDGVIFISSNPSTNDINKFIDLNIPLITADRTIGLDNIDNISVDNKKGAYDATMYLLSLGFTKIGCLSGPENISSSQQRVSGYKKALEDFNISINNNYIRIGDFQYESGFNYVKDFLKIEDRPKAVFVTNDMMALGFINGLTSKGIAVPKEISVIGFDDIDLAKIMSPRLSTVSQPIDLLAQKATELILNRINNKNNKISHIQLTPTLIVRESC